ncbi:BRCT domain-containing protein [Trypanosoma cruzi]|nr:BRCT domain-containing protein [Trypanosoma cruzi]
MKASLSSYEKDLPSDLLELIDHTTRGVQRLYETTRRRETLGESRERKAFVDDGRASARGVQHTEELAGTARAGGGAAVPPVMGKKRTAGLSSSSLPRTTTAAVHEDGPPRYCYQSENGRPLQQHHREPNNKDTSAESSGTNGARRWPWSRVQTLSMGVVADGRSGTSTTNTTLSSDAPSRTLLAHSTQGAARSGQNVSVKGTVNTSTTGTEDNNASQIGQRWKDTFRSLLSGAAANNTNTPTPAATEASAAPYENTHAEQRGPVANLPHETSLSLEATETRRQHDAHAFISTQTSAALERLRRQLAEQEASHREEVSRIRMEHNRELSQLRHEALETRQKSEEEVTTQLQASFNVKQKLLQVALEEERLQADEARKTVEEREKAIEKLKLELEAATSQRQSLQGDVDAKKRQVADLRESLTGTRKRLAELEEELTKRKGDLVESRQREKMMTMREKDALDLVSRLELQLREQDQRSREELRRLEAEFHLTTKSYQDLIGEATEKLTALEKVERKYHALKEQRRQQKEQKEELALKLTSVQEEKKHLTERLEFLQQELEQLRLQIARKEHEMREERAGHQKIVEGITQQLQEEEHKYCREVEALQQALRHAEDRTVRLEREVEGLSDKLKEEQAHSKQLLLKMEQSALRHREDLSSTRRSASAHQQQTESVLSSLRRQLREKDAKLEALATTASEPIQRLRNQLEDERSKRAHLEEQFNRYKERAKVAKEAALREIRREQQRAPFAPRSLSRTSAPPPSTSPSYDGGKGFLGAEPYTVQVSETTTPKDQRVPKAVLPLPPHSYERLRERSATTPQSSKMAQTGWDSVGSISNISRSSPLCSSRGEVIETVDPPSGDTGNRWDATQTTFPTSSQPPQLDNIDERVLQHEQILRDFHQSAAEVFRKITCNRDEFLEKCTSVVRSVSHRGGDDERFVSSTTHQGLLS